MGCCEMTFEQAVRDEIMKYINTLSTSNERKKRIIDLIENDLKKKSAALDSYHYQYREDDVNKVVEEYKEMIQKELNIQPQINKNPPPINQNPSENQNPNNNNPNPNNNNQNNNNVNSGNNVVK